FLWPSPETATLTLSGGSLDIPVHAGSAGDEWRFPPAETAPDWRHRQIVPDSYARRLEHDLVGNGRALVMTAVTGDAENLETGWIWGDTVHEEWRILPDDPQGAETRIDWEQRLGRGAWAVRTNVGARMTADADHFHLTATMTAHEGEEEVFRREF